VRGQERLSPPGGQLNRWAGPIFSVLDRRLFGFRSFAAQAIDSGWRDLGLELIHLPGHTPGHSGYRLATHNIIFCGDAAKHSGGRLSQPSRFFTLDPQRARASQHHLATLNAELYCFGHGPPLRRGATALRALAQTATRG